MKKIAVLALLSISLIAVIAVIGITRISSGVPTAEATHQTDVVILGCGPDEGQSTYLVESYDASALAPALGRVVSCTQALVVLTDRGLSVVGMVGRASEFGDGFLYTLIVEDIPHIRDEE